MRHLMIDFETLANTPNSAVLSLGAVLFTPDQILEEKYWVFDVFAQANAKLDIDFSTIAWWMTQGDEARALFKDCEKNGIKPGVVIEEFIAWIRAGAQYSGGPDWSLRLWGNGASFDPVIIENLIRRSNQKCPWHFSGHRCYRTIKKMYDIEKGEEFVGVKHHALDDARHQAKCLMKFFKANPQLEK